MNYKISIRFAKYQTLLRFIKYVWNYLKKLGKEPFFQKCHTLPIPSQLPWHDWGPSQGTHGEFPGRQLIHEVFQRQKGGGAHNIATGTGARC